ncbi:uncharacterized protein EI90DRAFT_3059872 [Cantharellus anzutake]|uniref:uncharacterized protein n=1 Tax=Cantharellus anzutake TaxID=1750568 RepID=UPI001902C76C|nr:uncharacterized protein EI90DRAFT_3059872 [Cantharellus anzutake]KAF8330921.1 hypothetical protein EI90DRAFT_3059872 [Cantharellus anzutake]
MVFWRFLSALSRPSRASSLRLPALRIPVSLDPILPGDTTDLHPFQTKCMTQMRPILRPATRHTRRPQRPFVCCSENPIALDGKHKRGTTNMV